MGGNDVDCPVGVTIPAAAAARAEAFAGRGWAAREVVDWVASGTERFLVITGEPGSGKTALAAWLAGAGPDPPDPTMVLEDTTTLDSMLGRVIRPALPTLTNRELSDVQDVVASGLSDGRPWDLAIGQQ
jgi:ABC-type molybdenum transport system ATPase subunit/photorepair protein PhrA